MTSYIRTAYGSSRGQRLLTLPFVLSIALFSIMVSALAMTEAAAASPAVWTAADRKAADDLAFQIVSSAPPNSLTLNLDPLIDALANSHQLDQARSLMRAASAPVLAGTDWALRYTLLAEEMGKIGDATDAIGLIPGRASLTDRTRVLELIAAGAAKGGHVADAAKIANDIISNASAEELQSVGGPMAATGGGLAWAIIDELAEAGDRSDVDTLVARLPNGSPRFGAEEDQASLECGGDRAEDQALIGEIKSEASALFSGIQNSAELSGAVEAFAEALALCQNPEAAKAFLGGAQLPSGVSLSDEYVFTAEGLALQHHGRAASMMLATVTDPNDLARVGGEIERAGDDSTAKSVALQALAARVTDTQHRVGYSSDLQLLQLLDQLQDFDDASKVVAASSDAGERVQDDSVIIDAEIKQRNLDALTKTIGSMLGNAGPHSSIQGLETTAEDLALGHFPGPAQRVFNAWETSQTLLKGEPLTEAEVRFAADMSDGDDAIRMAEENGPLVDHPNVLSTVVLGLMTLDGVKSPTAAQIAQAQQQALAFSQQVVIGTGGRSLYSAATGLAEAGNIPAALEAEDQLEQNSSSVLDSFRRGALSEIASAQAAAGDFEAALATCQKSPDVVDLKALTVLVAQPVSP